MPRAAQSPRVARRRNEQRARIVAVAARWFARDGLEKVRLDRLAEAADVSRGTLYSHFPSKQSLVDAVVRPALEQEAATLRRLADMPARRAVDGLLASTLELWRDHRDALRVVHGESAVPLGPEVRVLHEEIVQRTVALLERAVAARLVRSRDPRVAARLLAHLAVPILEATEPQSPDGTLFLASLRGLLLECDPPRRERSR
jgi:AcrR family transcriptional regulator